tara:strand:- start:40 stop:627 length:588 start_codon:yes stop_codon:yes gene_type:complete
MENKWSADIEAVLDNIRENCVLMSKTHKESYFFYKQVVKYFRIPTILLSSIGSVSSVGLTAYLHQNHISALTCGLALIVSILNSIELFLKITDTMEQENECSKAFYALAVNIRKTRMLERSRRQQEGSVYLEKTYAQYMTLMEKSNLLSGSIKDKFMELPKIPKPPKQKKSDSSSSSSSSGNSVESPLPRDDIDL